MLTGTYHRAAHRPDPGRRGGKRLSRMIRSFVYVALERLYIWYMCTMMCTCDQKLLRVRIAESTRASAVRHATVAGMILPDLVSKVYKHGKA